MTASPRPRARWSAPGSSGATRTTHARRPTRARAREAAAAEARAAVDGWRRAHADLRTAHDALGEEVAPRRRDRARLRSERAAPARESRLRASADLAPPPPPPPVSRQPPETPSRRRPPADAPGRVRALGPLARRGLPAAPGRARACGAAARRRAAPFSPRDARPSRRRAMRPTPRGALLLKESCWS